MILYFAIAFLLIVLWCYTSKFQEATHHWGRILAEQKSLNAELDEIENREIDPALKAQMRGYLEGKAVFNRGFQDAITPVAQNIRNITLYIGIISLFIAGFFLFKWYIPVITIIVMLFSVAILRGLLPSSNSQFFKNKIIKWLKFRLKKFKKNNDFLRMEAVDYFINKLENSLSDKEAKTNKHLAFINNLSSEANIRFVNKQYESVVALADKILPEDQSNYDAFTLRAMSLENLGYYLDAIDDYNSAIELKPTDANLIGLCGLCYNSIGNFEKAKEYLARSVKMGMKMYATNLESINILSEKTLELMSERRNTPERRKRRSGNEFTISDLPIDFSKIQESLRKHYEDLKHTYSLDPDNQEVKRLIDTYKKHFEDS